MKLTRNSSKVCFISLLAAAGAALSAPAMAIAGDEGPEYKWLLTSPLGPATVTAGSVLSGQAVANVLDNSGMSSTTYPSDKHSRFTGDMWSTNPNPSDPALVVNLGDVYPVGKILLWNYNPDTAYGNASGRGIKDFFVEYFDPQTWTWKQFQNPNTWLGLFALPQAPTSNEAANKDNPLDLKGLPTQYVRITPISNWGGFGNDAQLGHTYYGLSEVRVYRYAAQVTPGSFIPARAVAWSSAYPGSPANNTTNNYDMSDASSGGPYLDTTGTSGVKVGTKTKWVTAGLDAEPYVIYDLGGAYPINRMSVWNLNLQNWTTSGIKKFSVYFSLRNEGIKDNLFYNGWTRLLGPAQDGTFTLNQAPGTVASDRQLSVSFLVNNVPVRARYVAILPTPGKNVGNHDGGFYGLSQVRFYAHTSGYFAEPALYWDGLFARRSTSVPGFVFGDGAYSIPYTTGDSGPLSLFIFDDVGIGTWNPRTYAANTGGQPFRNNAYSVYYGGAALKPTSPLFEMNGADQTINPNPVRTSESTCQSTAQAAPCTFYWMQGGYQNGSNLYLAALRMRKVVRPTGVKIHQAAADIVTLPIGAWGLPGLGAPILSDANLQANQHDTKCSSFNENDPSQTIGFPAQLVKFGTKVYAYGWKGDAPGAANTKLIAARFDPQHATTIDCTNPNASSLEFWNGSGWVKTFTAVQSLMNTTSQLSGTWGNVSFKPSPFTPPTGWAFGTTYMYTTNVGVGPASIAFGGGPEGKFSEYIPLFVPDTVHKRLASFYATDPQIFDDDTFHATTAHPQLAVSGEALISTNLHKWDDNPRNNATEQSPKFYRIRKF